MQDISVLVLSSPRVVQDPGIHSQLSLCSDLARMLPDIAHCR